MNIAETVTAMRRPYEHRPVACFSDPARCRGGLRFRCAGTAPFGADPSAQAASAQTVVVVRRGRVATMLTHDGTTSRSRWSRARYCDGVSPTISVKRELNEPSDVQPTATQVSVTDIPWRSSAFARSMRRVMRYEYGVSP